MSTPPHLAVPRGIERRTIQTERGPFAALVGQQANSSDLVVLVPGFTGSKEDFISILQPLHDAGFAVVAFDQRGQHDTPGPEAADEYSRETFAADLNALAATIAMPGQSVHVVGHSFGGLVGRAAVIAAMSQWSSVTFMSSGPSAISPGHQQQLILVAAVLRAHGISALWEAIAAYDRSQGVPPPPDPQVADFLQRRFLANSPGSLLAMAEILMTEDDHDQHLCAAGIPVHVVAGVDDDVWTAAQQHQRARDIGALYSSIDNAGHSPAVEQPERTAIALIDFWRTMSVSN